MKYLKLVFFIVSLFFTLHYSSADELSIKNIKIDGNKRIPASYISNIVKGVIGKKISNSNINELTKKLYSSDFFSNVSISQSKNTLIVNVIEKSIISEIVFEGNDFFDDDQLIEIVDIKMRETFSERKINLALNRIRNEYSQTGRYLSNITVKKQTLPQSRVKVIFQIDEGEMTKVTRVNFTGNKFFSDDDLRNVIKTKEATFFRIFGSSIFKNQNVEIDKANLVRFYYERGYVDFKVLAYRRDLLPDYSGFNINIIVEEGKRYKINKIDIKNKLFKDKKQNLIKSLSIESGDIYNVRAVNASINILNENLGKKGYSFVKIDTDLRNKKNGYLDLVFLIDEGRKSYIRNINISGNTRTLDYVIRREILLLEGDPFNGQKLKESINAIKRLGYFSLVDLDLQKTEIENQVDINIKVKESLTGSFSFGIGYDSIEKEQITLGLNEKNFLGKGLKTRFELTTSGKSTRYNIGVTEPYYKDLPLLLSGDIFDEKNERSNQDIDKTGFGLAVGFDVKDYFNKFSYTFVESKTTKSASSTAASISGEEGIEIQTSSIGYLISKDTRDNFFNPKSGSRFLANTTFAGVGGDARFIKLESKYKNYTPFSYGDYVLSLAGNAGMITSVDDEKITSSNRFYFNSRSVRGFDRYGIGPRDTGNDDIVGGNNYYSGTVELRTKKFTPDDSGIEWSIFSDFGSLWDTDYPTNVKGIKDSSPRVSAGVSVYWTTPIGPLNFTWGWPVQEEDYDKDNNFRFSIGTSF